MTISRMRFLYPTLTLSRRDPMLSDRLRRVNLYMIIMLPVNQSGGIGQLLRVALPRYPQKAVTLIRLLLFIKAIVWMPSNLLRRIATNRPTITEPLSGSRRLQDSLTESPLMGSRVKAGM